MLWLCQTGKINLRHVKQLKTFLTVFYCTLLLIWTEAPPISRLSLCPDVFPRGRWSCLFAVWLGGGLQRWKTLTWPQRPSCQPKTERQTIKKKNLAHKVHNVSLHTISCSWTTLFHFCSVTFPAAKRPKGSSSSPTQWKWLRLHSDWQTANTPPTETRGKPTQGIFQLKWDWQTKKSTQFRFHATSTVVQHYKQAGRNSMCIILSNQAKIFKKRYCSRVCWAALSSTSQRRQTSPQHAAGRA